MTPDDRSMRNQAMAWERARRLTIRAIAKRHGLSKSRVHQLVRYVERLPPPPRFRYELVQSPGGGFTAALVAT